DLDILTKQLKRVKPKFRLRYLIGFLRTHGVQVQRERVRKSLLSVDGEPGEVAAAAARCRALPRLSLNTLRTLSPLRNIINSNLLSYQQPKHIVGHHKRFNKYIV
ncbi:hypothetical protein B0H17DRAFT_937156, partial [Mycena rosella]